MNLYNWMEINSIMQMLKVHNYYTGTDAVGAAVGGLVIDGHNGFVVREKNAVALAQAMQKMLNNEKLHSIFSRNAIQTISSWDNDHMVAGFSQAISYVYPSKGA